jgi:PAS domain S-box-containing protein
LKFHNFLSHVIDFEIVNSVGRLLIVEVSLRCVRTPEGEFMFYSGMARNVTQSRIDRQALVESEMKYKLLADNINDVIWTSDLNLNTTYISPSVYRLEGYKPEERKTLSIDKILTPRSLQFVNELMNRILLEYAEGLRDFEESSELFDIEIIRKDGSKFWAEVNASLMFDTEGNVVGISGVTRDISDRKKIENALKASEKKLLELNATKDKFFSILAHDLKNPFNSILGFSNELVQNYNTYNDEERKQFVSTIQSSAQGAYQLLGNLLEWSTLQTGRLSVSKTSFFMFDLVKEVLYEVTAQVLAKNIVLENQVNTELQVYADRKMIATVIRNLISNAIKFTEKSGFIAINSSISEDIATVSVKDSGKGMKPELVIKLFKIQEKLSTVGTAGEKGTGLGLILCKEFVEQNGGKIWVSSKWQEGSTFFFTLQKV